MQQNNISARVQSIIIEKLAVDSNDVTLEKFIKYDLGADSLDLIEVIMALEQEFMITIPDEECEDDLTVQQAITLVEERCGGTYTIKNRENGESAFDVNSGIEA